MCRGTLVFVSVYSVVSVLLINRDCVTYGFHIPKIRFFSGKEMLHPPPEKTGVILNPSPPHKMSRSYNGHFSLSLRWSWWIGSTVQMFFNVTTHFLFLENNTRPL